MIPIAAAEPNEQEWVPYAAIDTLYRLGWDGVWWECEKISSPATVVCMIHVGAEAVALYRNGTEEMHHESTVGRRGQSLTRSPE